MSRRSRNLKEARYAKRDALKRLKQDRKQRLLDASSLVEKKKIREECRLQRKAIQAKYKQMRKVEPRQPWMVRVGEDFGHGLSSSLAKLIMLLAVGGAALILLLRLTG